MDVGPYEVRAMKEEEIPQAIDIWTETGLAEGTHTLYTWYAVDPEGIYVAVNENGEIYGTCGAVILNDDLAFLGLYAVKPKYRKKGIGVKIWQAVMQHVGDRNAGLNSVPHRLYMYRDHAGFKLVTKWRIKVYVSENINTELLLSSLPNVTISEINLDTLAQVIKFDESVRGYNQSKILTHTTKEKDSVSLVAQIKNSDGCITVCGYGCIRKNLHGTGIIGPLYADDVRIAEVLLSNLVSYYSNFQKTGFSIMVIDCNAEAMALVKKLEMPQKSNIPRCYTKYEIDAVFSKIFSVHSLNFAAF